MTSQPNDHTQPDQPDEPDEQDGQDRPDEQGAELWTEFHATDPEGPATNVVPLYGTPDHSTSERVAEQSAGQSAEQDGRQDDPEESAELDEQGEPGEVVPVDPPGSGRVRLADKMRAGERRPVLPAWATSGEQFRAALVWVAGHYAHTIAYHGVRLPVYSARLALRAPVGVGRLVGSGSRWLVDAEGMPVRLDAVRRADAEMYLKLIRHRDARVRGRTILSTLGTFAALFVLTGFLSGLLPVPSFLGISLVWLVLAGLIGALGVVGSPVDKPIASAAVVAPQVARLTSEVVVRALGALGLAEINKALVKSKHGITFTAPITRDGPGWRADVELPYGVTVTDIMERRDRLASGLRRPVGCVWPEPAHDQHAGRLVLWVGDLDMSQTKPAPWPLTRDSKPISLFEPVPFGTDQRGRPVKVLLAYSNVLVGAMPGAGKTFALKPLLLAAMLDETARVLVFELKGSGDLAFAEQVAHRYASGPDDATIEQTVMALREVYKDLESRAKTIAALPRDVCPENKVTAALARRRHLGLYPCVVAIDECQELFSHSSFGKEAGELCTAIIKRGRALGVILILATQRPDKDSLPTGISANVGTRFCLRVMGQVENDMILGTSAYRNGIRASTFTARDKGIGYLVGASDDPLVTRSAYIDGPTADKIAARARAARIAAGVLTGHAAGDTPTDTTASTNLLDDMTAVWPSGKDGAEKATWSETLVAHLIELRPDTYAEWTAEQLAAALKPYGIRTTQIGRRIDGADGKVTNRRGITHDALTNAVAERDRRRDAG